MFDRLERIDLNRNSENRFTLKSNVEGPIHQKTIFRFSTLFKTFGVEWTLITTLVELG
jgi:hypothetical protein